jgi:hypothetical protein
MVDMVWIGQMADLLHQYLHSALFFGNLEYDEKLQRLCSCSSVPRENQGSGDLQDHLPTRLTPPWQKVGITPHVI